ncbi:AprI/Inh family metalloprotease inhibitor [Devosia soli]|uniref:AprI/Inh family metalloprotease inhibitor n=1 Tax=Devosia soli TaxID=361041 RepID=UPI00069B4303|nr:AprI/Inh family metalloprotease inhibitor [Devosia soli]
MKVWMRGATTAFGLGLSALALAACSTTSQSNTANLNVVRPPQQLAPVQSSSVQQGTLPAIGATGTPAPGLSGTPVLGGAPAMTTATATTTAPGLGTNSSIVNVGAPTAGFSAGPEGVWTVTAGATTCQLNLPMTAKTGTNYYRASAPGCTVTQIASVTGWQQVGSQLQLYDDNGNIAAFLAPSGGRYIGTMGGGQAISMSR